MIRRATEADRDLLQALWGEFVAELDEPDYGRDTWEQAWGEMRDYIAKDVALLAGEDGYALARLERDRVGYLSDLYVRPVARRGGVAKALIAEAAAALAERGAEVLTLNVNTESKVARAVYRRLGFREESIDLVVELPALRERVAAVDKPPSRAWIHVQSDDERGVERAVEQFRPRLERPDIERRGDWIRIVDPLCDRDRAAQSVLARDLSDRLGAVVVALALEEGAVVRFLLHERGRMVDEYLSVPTYYGPLEQVDELALAANPTLVARLTGADPAEVRRVARTAASPAELPPAEELLAAVAGVMGLEC